MFSADLMPPEDPAAYYIDGINRAWFFDDVEARWWSPDIPGTSCTWRGVAAYVFDRHGQGSLRKANAGERVRIEAIMAEATAAEAEAND